jgi:hypothetical protein
MKLHAQVWKRALTRTVKFSFNWREKIDYSPQASISRRRINWHGKLLQDEGSRLCLSHGGAGGGVSQHILFFFFSCIFWKVDVFLKRWITRGLSAEVLFLRGDKGCWCGLLHTNHTVSLEDPSRRTSRFWIADCIEYCLRSASGNSKWISIGVKSITLHGSLKMHPGLVWC